jgi:hypothetical protein
MNMFYLSFCFFPPFKLLVSFAVDDGNNDLSSSRIPEPTLAQMFPSFAELHEKQIHPSKEGRENASEHLRYFPSNGKKTDDGSKTPDTYTDHNLDIKLWEVGSMSRGVYCVYIEERFITDI